MFISVIKKIVFMVLVFCSIGCDTQEVVKVKQPIFNKNTIYVDASFNEKQSPLELSDYLTGVHYIKLGKTNDFLIGDVDKVIFKDDKIYILDASKSKSLFVFNLKGDPIFKIASVGKGPGEYLKINDFDINPITKELWLHDLKTDNIVVFDSLGTFVKEIRPEFNFYNFSFLKDGNVAFYVYKGENYKDPSNRNQLFITNQNFDIRLEAFPASNELKNISFLFPDAIRSFNHETTFYPELGNSLFRIIGDSLICKYSLNFGKQQVDLKKLINVDQYDFVRLSTAEKWMYFSGNYSETDNSVYFGLTRAYGPETVLFYSKNSGKRIIGRELNLADPNHFFWKRPMGVAGREFFAVISAADMVKSKEFFLPVPHKSVKKPLIDILAQTNENDNPVLILYSLREF